MIAQTPEPPYPARVFIGGDVTEGNTETDHCNPLYDKGISRRAGAVELVDAGDSKSPVSIIESIFSPTIQLKDGENMGEAWVTEIS